MPALFIPGIRYPLSTSHHLLFAIRYSNTFSFSFTFAVRTSSAT